MPWRTSAEQGIACPIASYEETMGASMCGALLRGKAISTIGSFLYDRDEEDDF